MGIVGLMLFALSMPLAMVGLCDPNARRGNAVAILATVAAPVGLLIAAA